MKLRSWDIVVVPFPFSDKNSQKVRPALIVSSDVLHGRNAKYFVAMITSASNAAHFGDVSISDIKAAGLPAASVVRASKLAVIEVADIHKRVGSLPAADRAKIAKQLQDYLAT